MRGTKFLPPVKNSVMDSMDIIDTPRSIPSMMSMPSILQPKIFQSSSHPFRCRCRHPRQLNTISVNTVSGSTNHSMAVLNTGSSA